MLGGYILFSQFIHSGCSIKPMLMVSRRGRVGSRDREPPARLLDEGGQGGAERAAGYGHDVIAVQTGELHSIDRKVGR